jgi:hypothetical protein
MPEIRDDQMGGVPSYVDGEVVSHVGSNQTPGENTDTSTGPESLVVLK